MKIKTVSIWDHYSFQDQLARVPVKLGGTRMTNTQALVFQVDYVLAFL